MQTTDDPQPFDVVVIGSLNLDLVATADRLPGPGETVHGTSFVEVPGGKGLNQAVAAARAGAAVAFVGAVGDDAAGERLRAVARDDGIDDSRLSTVDGVPSGRALINVDGRGENSIVVVAGSNGHVAVDDLPPTRVVLAQLETNPDVVVAGLRAARRQGALTILNPAPADRVPEGVLELCDVVVPNEHELEVLGGIDELRRAGVSTVVVTRGGAGVDAFVDGEPLHVAAFPVHPVDTTGAGDSFCGALASRLAAGDPLPTAVRFAAAAGALATTIHGAVPSIPHRDAIDGLLRGDDSLPAGSATPPAARTEAPPPPAPRDVAAAYLAAFATGDPERVAALVTDDFVNDHASSLGSGCVGKEEYRRRLPGFLGSFVGLRYDVERLVVDDDVVAATYRMSAESNGSPIDIRGVMVIETRGGLVARRTDYWDALTFLRQTGQAD